MLHSSIDYRVAANIYGAKFMDEHITAVELSFFPFAKSDSDLAIGFTITIVHSHAHTQTLIEPSWHDLMNRCHPFDWLDLFE